MCSCVNHPNEVLYRDVASLNKSSYGCKKCSKKYSPSIEEVASRFSENGYILLSDSYTNNSSVLLYICKKHPESIRKTNWNSFNSKKSGCFECGKEKLRDSKAGEKNPNWRGGSSELNGWLRSCIDVWRRNKKKSLDRCFVSGMKSKNLEIHHSYSFFKIRDITLNKLNLDKREKVSDYSQEEIYKIKEMFLRLNSISCGVAIDRDIHKMFHRIYGRNVNYRDLKEFKERYLKGDFKNDVDFARCRR